MIFGRELKREIGYLNFGIRFRSRTDFRNGIFPNVSIWFLTIHTFPEQGEAFQKAKHYKGFFYTITLDHEIWMRKRRLFRIKPRSGWHQFFMDILGFVSTRKSLGENFEKYWPDLWYGLKDHWWEWKYLEIIYPVKIKLRLEGREL